MFTYLGITVYICIYLYIYIHVICIYLYLSCKINLPFVSFQNPRLPLLSDGRKSLQVTNLNSPRNHVDVSESKALDPPEDPQRIEETSVNQSDSVSKIRKKVVILVCFFFRMFVGQLSRMGVQLESQQSR